MKILLSVLVFVLSVVVSLLVVLALYGAMQPIEKRVEVLGDDERGVVCYVYLERSISCVKIDSYEENYDEPAFLQPSV